MSTTQAKGTTAAEPKRATVSQGASTPPVHVTPEQLAKRARFEQDSEAARTRHEEARITNAIALNIRKTQWGQDLHPLVAKAIAEWSRRHGIDAVTEVYVLGGNIYLNAQFYLNRLAPLIAAGLLTKAPTFTQFHDDDRLLGVITGTELPEGLPVSVVQAAQVQAAEEWVRRRQLRVKYNVPEGAVAACLVEIHIKGVATPFEGVKFITDEQNKYGKPADPIGVAKPMETVETRALRRALKQCIAQLPVAEPIRAAIQAAETDAEFTLDEAVAVAGEREQAALQGGVSGQMVAAPDGEYAEQGTAPQVPVRAADDEADDHWAEG